MPSKTKAELEEELAQREEELEQLREAQAKGAAAAAAGGGHVDTDLVRLLQETLTQIREDNRLLRDELRTARQTQRGGNAGGAAGAAANANQNVRAPAAPAPKKLELGITLHQWAGWRATYTDYAAANNLTELPRDRQVAHLKSNFSEEFRTTFNHAIPVRQGDNATVENILDAIHTHLRGQTNVAQYRVEFEERKRAEGETVDNFYVALQVIAENADLCNHCKDARLVTRLMAGINDKQTQHKLLTEHPFPNLQVTTCFRHLQITGDG